MLCVCARRMIEAAVKQRRSCTTRDFCVQVLLPVENSAAARVS